MTASAPLPLGIPTWRKRRVPADRTSFPQRLPLLAATVIAAGALAATPALAKKRPTESFRATLPTAPAPRPADGSIFSASAGYAPLHGGTRASQVGDAVTILLVETTSAAKTVGSQSQKNGSFALTPPTTGPYSFDPNALNASNNTTFKGSGNAAQTSSLNATLSVTIAEVRANGTAVVRGEKRMLLSQGEEWVQVSGIVRLIDIDANNTIPSSRVANAHIAYSGKGALQRASKQGWLGQFFNMISPF